MSFTSTARKAVQAIAGHKTVHARMRTNASWPIEVRNDKTGLPEMTSRHLRAGIVYEFDPNDETFKEWLEKRNLFLVEEQRDDNGKRFWAGIEPVEPPHMDPPISMKLDPTAQEAQTMNLLRRIADALDGVAVKPKGAA